MTQLSYFYTITGIVYSSTSVVFTVVPLTTQHYSPSQNELFIISYQASGATGLQGLPGTATNTGATGPTGSQGLPGIATNTGATGPQGYTGSIGLQGIPGIAANTGAAGAGFPPGGTSGQVLAKIDATNYNTQWISGVGNVIGPYIFKFTTLGTGIGSLNSAIDQAGAPLVGWSVTFPSAQSITIVYPASITGTFTNFRRMSGNAVPGNASAPPFAYTLSSFVSGGVGGAGVSIDLATRTIYFTNASSAQYGFTSVVDATMYILFDLIQTPVLP